MEALQGRRALSLDASSLARRLAGEARVLVDLGTGDGRFVHHVATADPGIVAVGIDACREQLRDASRRAPANALYLIAGVEALPPTISRSASWLTVNFPWGSLLRGLLDAGPAATALACLARPGARLEVRLNAGALAEAGLELDAGAERVRQVLRDVGFPTRTIVTLGPAELRALPTTWARRLAFGRDPRGVELRAVCRGAAAP